jgi:hypothetical protein
VYVSFEDFDVCFGCAYDRDEDEFDLKSDFNSDARIDGSLDELLPSEIKVKPLLGSRWYCFCPVCL